MFCPKKLLKKIMRPLLKKKCKNTVFEDGPGNNKGQDG